MVHKPEYDMDNELIWAQLQTVGSRLVNISSFYSLRNPKATDVWVGGDFNVTDTDCTTPAVKSYANKTSLCQQLFDVCTDHSL